MKTNEFWWHNFIDGNQDPQLIIQDAEYCLSIAKMLAEAVTKRAIELTGGDSQPSLTMWDVLDEELYEEVCSKYELKPDEFVIEFEDEDEEAHIGGDDNGSSLTHDND